LFPVLSYAEGFTLSGYFETGTRSQAEDFEEEEKDREYNFRNYRINLGHIYSNRLSYGLSSFIYDKDYKSDDSLDNISRIFRSNGSYYLTKQKQKSLKIDIKLKYKRKRYRNSPSNEFDQVSFSPGLKYSRKDAYGLSVRIGLNNYDYVNRGDRDEIRFYTKMGVKRYLFEKRLVTDISYRIETSTRKLSDRRKNKNNFSSGFVYLFDSPFIKRVSSRVEFGKRDVKDIDDRDEDFDYTYRKFYARTEHRIYSGLIMNITYQYFRKNYLSADLDHSGFSLRNNWKYIMTSDQRRELYFKIIVEHKEVDYPILKEDNYQKETFIITGTYRKKQDWKASTSMQGSFYDFIDSVKERNRYYLRISFDKFLPRNDVTLSLGLKYKYTDNRHANDSEEESMRFAFRYKFS
jgi:hypothetical protein